MATATNETLNGKPSSAECSLSKWIFSGYFANENGEKIDKINFGVKVRFYIDSYCKYNAKIKFHIKSKSVNPPLVQPNVDILVKEATIKELNPSTIVDDKRYVEIQLKKRNEYKSLSADGDYELCCSVTDGLICFIAQDDVAKITIEVSQCICEYRVRAFMTMLRVGEGTVDDDGYSRIVGGKSFTYYKKDFSDHPNILVKLNDKISSTAAGAYQITFSNYNDIGFKTWRTQNGITDFSPKNQDMCCYWLLKYNRKAIEEIKKGNIKKAITLCSKEWATGYGQREESLYTVLKKYDAFFNDEVDGTMRIQIKRGFLKDVFNESCAGGCPEDIKSRNDNMK